MSRREGRQNPHTHSSKAPRSEDSRKGRLLPSLAGVRKYGRERKVLVLTVKANPEAPLPAWAACPHFSAQGSAGRTQRPGASPRARPSALYPPCVPPPPAQRAAPGTKLSRTVLGKWGHLPGDRSCALPGMCGAGSDSYHCECLLWACTHPPSVLGVSGGVSPLRCGITTDRTPRVRRFLPEDNSWRI